MLTTWRVRASGVIGFADRLASSLAKFAGMIGSFFTPGSLANEIGSHKAASNRLRDAIASAPKGSSELSGTPLPPHPRGPRNFRDAVASAPKCASGLQL